MEIVAYRDWADVTPTGPLISLPTPTPRLWLHHGAGGTSTVKTARVYARYHVVKRGYSRVGYSFLIAEGKILEGRGAGVIGAHTLGDNSFSHGICMVGDYTLATPSPADLDALKWLVSHGASERWWATSSITGGHRDAPGASTSCPGDALYALIPQINAGMGEEMNPRQEAKLDAALARLAEIERTLGSRPGGKVLDDLGKIRRTMRAYFRQQKLPEDQIEV